MVEAGEDGEVIGSDASDGDVVVEDAEGCVSQVNSYDGGVLKERCCEEADSSGNFGW